MDVALFGKHPKDHLDLVVVELQPHCIRLGNLDLGTSQPLLFGTPEAIERVGPQLEQSITHAFP